MDGHWSMRFSACNDSLAHAKQQDCCVAHVPSVTYAIYHAHQLLGLQQPELHNPVRPAFRTATR